MNYEYFYNAGNIENVISPTAALGIFSAIMLPVLIIGLALYVYSSWALMTIAKKTDTPNAWLAWIPIANLYLMTQVAQIPWWTFLLFFYLGFQ